MQTTTERHGDTTETLNVLLRGELSAVETYRQALEKITRADLRRTLEENLASHRSRVQIIRDKILALGGKPAESSGAWGAFAKLIEGGAKVFGERAAIAALEEGEDHGLRDYRDEAKNLTGDLRLFVDGQLMAAQERTHLALSALKKTIH